MGNKLKAISKVSVALALLGAAVPAVEAAPTAMAAKKATKKAKKSTKKVVKKSTKKAKKAKKTTKKKATKKVAKKPAKKVAKKNTKKVTKKSTKKAIKKPAKKAIKKPAKKTVKKPVKKSMPKKTVKKTARRAAPASANLTFYNSKGKPTSYWPAKDGLKKTPKKGDKVVVKGQGIINGQLMYEIAQNPSVYVPAKDVKVDYFKNVVFVDYYLGSGTPAQIKAEYDADLAKAEKNDPAGGYTDWFEAHPLEALRMYSKDTKVSKSTYEKHNLTYAQSAAQDGRMSVGYTKESYTAYINGEAAYRQYEAKWAAKYPNITRYMKENSNTIKKYNLNTFEWHYNDNFYINIRK